MLKQKLEAIMHNNRTVPLVLVLSLTGLSDSHLAVHDEKIACCSVTLLTSFCYAGPSQAW